MVGSGSSESLGLEYDDENEVRKDPIMPGDQNLPVPPSIKSTPKPNIPKSPNKAMRRPVENDTEEGFSSKNLSAHRRATYQTEIKREHQPSLHLRPIQTEAFNPDS